jgi:hypothetical protein
VDSWWILAPGAAPWWYTGLLTGILGVTGIVSGAVVTYKSVKASDERRNTYELERLASVNNREDQQRWFDHIRTLCAKMIAIDYAIELLTYEGAEPHEVLGARVDSLLEETKRDGNYSERKEEIKIAYEEFATAIALNTKITDLKNDLYACLTEIRLVAPNDIVVAAGKLFEVSVERPAIQDAKLDEAHHKAHTRFIKVVKDTIGTRESK